MTQQTNAQLKSVFLELNGLIYDEDSKLIWIPHDSNFEEFLDLKNIAVQIIDPESALVSKAIKAPGKNKQLIRQAIASNRFPELLNRILEHGGIPENIL